MNKKLKEIINKLNNNVLVIDLDEDLLNLLEKNKNIVECVNLSSKGGKKKFSLSKSKTIKIQKIRKYFKKKKIDYIICNYDSIDKYLNTFVKDSVYLNNNKLYLFGNIDIDLIEKRYKRYNTKIEVYSFKNTYIVEIDNTNSKNNFIKDFLYQIVDVTNNILEIVGDILMG